MARGCGFVWGGEGCGGPQGEGVWGTEEETSGGSEPGNSCSCDQDRQQNYNDLGVRGCVALWPGDVMIMCGT